MKKRMLYLRKTPVQSAFIIYLLALGLILFPTQWLGDLFFAEEKTAVLFGLGGMRVVMGAVMALIARAYGIFRVVSAALGKGRASGSARGSHRRQ